MLIRLVMFRKHIAMAMEHMEFEPTHINRVSNNIPRRRPPESVALLLPSLICSPYCLPTYRRREYQSC